MDHASREPCSTRGRDRRCMQKFGVKILVSRLFRCWWEDNIKIGVSALDSCGLRQGPVTTSCQISLSTKFEEFLGKMNTYYLLH
jgi:hypothetical protein